jgi:hypothetical protein
LFAVPLFMPGIYDGITSRKASMDNWFGELIRAPFNSEINAVTITECRSMREQISENYSAELDKIRHEPGSVSVNATTAEIARQDAMRELSSINSGFCKDVEAPVQFPAMPTVPLVVTPPAPASTPQVVIPVHPIPSAPMAVTPNSFRVTVSSTKPWTDTGISLAGKTVTIRRVSGTWNNVNDAYDQSGEGLGPYPGTIMETAPIGELIANTGDSFHRIGTSGRISNSRGNLLLGMNEVPGKYRDNHGSLEVEITVQ